MDVNHFAIVKITKVDVVQIVRSILDDTALALQQKGIATRLTMPQQDCLVSSINLRIFAPQSR